MYMFVKVGQMISSVLPLCDINVVGGQGNKGILLWTLQRGEEAAQLQVFVRSIFGSLDFFLCHGQWSSSVVLYLASPRSSLNVLGCNHLEPAALLHCSEFCTFYFSLQGCFQTRVILRSTFKVGIVLLPFTEESPKRNVLYVNLFCWLYAALFNIQGASSIAMSTRNLFLYTLWGLLQVICSTLL